MKAKPIYLNGNPDERIIAYQIYCPGCECTHELPIEKGTPYSATGCWTLSGGLEYPSFSPSLNIATGSLADPNHVDDPELPPTRYHSYIVAGNMEYLWDSTHALRGSVVTMPEI